ncbi:MAG: ADP-ribosylglycohydrolase family protein [Desulfobacterales bacterium]|nr:ADP-ribosylglycohydrolase family protein [Desulfobacterales bacterium]
MLGAIIGDIVGSIYEGNPLRTIDFPLFGRKADFTDDTVLTIAIAYSILEGIDYATSLRRFGKKYTAGYGTNFYNWLYGLEHTSSWGNGSAMRVSPIGYAFNSEDDVLFEAKKSAVITHNHPDGIKGAQATALAIFLARMGASKEKIKIEISGRFNYDLNRTIDEIRPIYYFKSACEESVPESILAFLESKDVESAIRNAVSLGGDADTMACIAGGIAQAYYKEIPTSIIHEVKSRIPNEFIEIIDRFNLQFNINYIECLDAQSEKFRWKMLYEQAVKEKEQERLEKERLLTLLKKAGINPDIKAMKNSLHLEN